MKVIACQSCDILLEYVEAEPGTSLYCPRCGSRLYGNKKDSIDRTLALSFTGLIFFYPAIVLPLLTLYSMGMDSSASVLMAILRLYEEGYILVSVLVFLTAVLCPFINISILFYVSFGLKLGLRLPLLSFALRCSHFMKEWCMAEVFMLGILITIVKMYHMAYITYDTGFFCFSALMVAALFSSTSMDEYLFWNRIGDSKRELHKR